MSPKNKIRSQRKRGSMLLMTMFAVTIVALAVGSLMEYVSGSYRISMRQRRYLQVKTAAENEMEFIFYRWKETILNNAIASATDTGMRTLPPLMRTSTFNRSGSHQLASNYPFMSSMPGLGTSADYIVTRSVDFDPNRRRTGLTPLPVQKTGQMSYFVAQAGVSFPDKNFGPMNINVGRRFVYSETSVFQYSVFYQGDIEFSPGNSMTIKGDVSSNSDVYLGVIPPGPLNIMNKVRYAGTYNGDVDPTLGTKRSHYGNSAALYDPTFASGRGSQVEQLREKENFLGGVDVDAVIAAYPTAYDSNAINGTSYTGSAKTDADRNTVYRAVIAPPPAVAEDPTIAGRRMYNRAGLIVKVDAGAVHAYVANNGVLGTEITSELITNGVLEAAKVREPHYDYREGQQIKMTTLNVAALKTVLSNSTTIPDLSAAYNGFVYVYDTDPKGTNYKAGVRLVNGSDVPDLDSGVVKGNAATGEFTGFTVATNNGLYIQGDYNTVGQVSDPSKPKSAAVLGDAVTVLSETWKSIAEGYDSSVQLGSRPAASHVKTHDFDQNGQTTVVAAIVSGNTASVDGTNSSGGVQNLVRYLENWQTLNVKLFGSLGQLFNSDHFRSFFKNAGYANNVYGAPTTRELEFDENLAKNPKGGWPSTTAFYRGDYYTW